MGVNGGQRKGFTSGLFMQVGGFDIGNRVGEGLASVFELVFE